MAGRRRSDASVLRPALTTLKESFDYDNEDYAVVEDVLKKIRNALFGLSVVTILNYEVKKPDCDLVVVLSPQSITYRTAIEKMVTGMNLAYDKIRLFSVLDMEKELLSGKSIQPTKTLAIRKLAVPLRTRHIRADFIKLAGAFFALIILLTLYFLYL